MVKRRKTINVDDPLFHADHPRPASRRDFLKQGFISGSAMVTAGGVFSLFANPNEALAAVSGDLTALAGDVNCSLNGAGSKVPVICFDLAGGANFSGSNVLVGQNGRQTNFLSAAGYSKLGLPGDMLPGGTQTITPLNPSTNNDNISDQLGLLFHADSPMLMGILEKAGAAVGSVDGTVIPARSGNDTQNNPHNPMYGIALAGGTGDVVTLVGSQSSDSGGRSMAPAMLINPEIRPTKVDRPSDVTGMVDVGDLQAVLSSKADVTAVMESMARISHQKMKLGAVTPGLTDVTRNEVLKDLVQCGYIKAADIADKFVGVPVDPDDRDDVNGDIVGAGRIFTEAEFDGDREFQKTASVMKMVIDRHAGAGTVAMGGYDYHTGNRFVGENRDLRAGRCIGACLNYAQRRGQPLMIYVFSDGSLASNGTPDDSAPQGNNELGGRGKGQWTGDNSSTAASFVLVYNPNGVTPYNGKLIEDARQIGSFTADGSVIRTSSPAANNVNLLVNTMILNYMALNGDVTPGNYSAFNDLFTGLGTTSGLSNLDDLISFGTLT